MPKAQALLFRYLDTDGDGGGTKNANGDYSSTATDFKLSPASGERFEIARLNVAIGDSGQIDSGKYGNNITLTNGITVAVKNAAGVIVDITDGVPVMRNPDWSHLAGVDALPMEWGTGVGKLVVRFTFERTGVPLQLDGSSGEYLAVTLNDDFSGLSEHYFMAQGRHS